MRNRRVVMPAKDLMTPKRIDRVSDVPRFDGFARPCTRYDDQTRPAQQRKVPCRIATAPSRASMKFCLELKQLARRIRPIKPMKKAMMPATMGSWGPPVGFGPGLDSLVDSKASVERLSAESVTLFKTALNRSGFCRIMVFAVYTESVCFCKHQNS